MTCLGGSGSRFQHLSSKNVASFVDSRVTRALQGQLPPPITFLILFLTRLRAGPPCASWVHTRDISPLLASGMPHLGQSMCAGSPAGHPQGLVMAKARNRAERLRGPRLGCLSHCYEKFRSPTICS